jgi:hypothetical protein
MRGVGIRESGVGNRGGLDVKMEIWERCVVLVLELVLVLVLVLVISARKECLSQSRKDRKEGAGGHGCLERWTMSMPPSGAARPQGGLHCAAACEDGFSPLCASAGEPAR